MDVKLVLHTAAVAQLVVAPDCGSGCRGFKSHQPPQCTTLPKYRTFTNQVKAYAEHRGYVFLDQLTVGDMDRFYSSWKDGIRAKAKKLDRLKTFISFCLKREWLAKDITGDLQAPAGSSVTLPKAPFTDEELNRIFAACDAIGQPVPQGPGYRTWTR